MDLNALRWELILGLFLGKCVVFLLVAGVSLVISGNIGIAGLLAVFCVHCNDFPVGKPVLSGLYENHGPDMGHYFFFIPQMILLFFMPLGTFMINIHKAQRSECGSTNEILKWTQAVSKKEVKLLFKSLQNSIPLMSAMLLGLIFNITFKRHLPPALYKPIKVVAVTVPGMVQCTAGFCMVRKERYLMSSSAIIAFLLIAVKMILTPIINYTITSFLAVGSESPKEVTDFALLYGIVPPAAVIFLAGQEFRNPLAVMSATFILSTFLSYPMSFAVARFTLVPAFELNHYVPQVQAILYWAACISLFCDVFVILSNVWNRRCKQTIYRYVLCLLVTQIFTSCGIILWKYGDETNPWLAYLQVILYFGGEISCFIWLGITALLLVWDQKYAARLQRGFRTICFTIFTICGVISIVACVITLLSDAKDVYIIGRPTSNFEFLQLGTSTAFLTLCISIIGGCLLQHFRKTCFVSKTKNREKCGSGKPIFYTTPEKITDLHFKRNGAANVKYMNSQQEETKMYYEEVLQNGGIKRTDNAAQDSTNRLCSLLLLQFIVLSLKLFSNTYKLTESRSLEIMIPLEFLQSTLFIGQGVFFFLTCGIDVRTLSINLTTWCRKIRYGKEEFVPKHTDLAPDLDVVQFCNQFNEFFISKCSQMIMKDRKWNSKVYKDCFWGHQLVDWMIEEGLAKDDVEAEDLGQKLLLGGILRHVEDRRHFHDAPYLYSFTKRQMNLHQVPCAEIEMQEVLSNTCPTKC